MGHGSTGQNSAKYSNMSFNKVLIIGSGPAGLTLAQYLKRHDVPIQVVEKAPVSRLQGYSVSIHFALPYLVEALGEDKMKDFEEYVSVNHTKSTGVALVNYDGKVLLKLDGIPALSGKGIRANRSRIRNRLMEGINVESDVDVTEVNFGDHQAVAKTSKGDISADLVVGADGLRSAVRASIIGNKVQELDVVNLSASRNITRKQHEIFRKYSPTHFIMFGPKSSDKQGVVNFFYSINDVSEDGKTYNVRWVLSWDQSLDHHEIPDTNDGLHKIAHDMAEQFSEPIKNLIQTTDPSVKLWFNHVCQCMPDYSWDGKGQVTLIGDALHAMTAYRGEGLNHAVMDAVLLGE
jgi:2-polyprenyl-6-methoxyphenol hydroxylase-like FAD-dependent oxidoreductase